MLYHRVLHRGEQILGFLQLQTVDDLTMDIDDDADGSVEQAKLGKGGPRVRRSTR